MVVLSYTVYMVLRYKHIVVFPFSRVNCIREITVVNSGDLSIYINTFWGGGEIQRSFTTRTMDINVSLLMYN